MHSTSLTVSALAECLAGIPPLELKGTALLRECRPASGLVPAGLPRAALTAAISEIVDYTGRCTAAARRLSHLTPVPLLHVIGAYGL